MKLPSQFQNSNQLRKVPQGPCLPWLHTTLMRSMLFTVALACAPISWAETTSPHTDKTEIHAFDQKLKDEIQGKVIDASGEPLIGVTIRVKGVPGGVTTNVNGEFTIKTTHKQEQLTFSYIGYKKKEVTVKNGERIQVMMEEDSNSLQDVVVTGFVTKNKSSYTGAQTTIQGDQLLSVGTKNLLESLQAFVPGMQIANDNSMGSDPNSRPDITIRGRSSFEGAANLPIFVVDGSIVPVDYIYDMDMNDIESVTVLKDASASALYGAKASAGVVIITTKSMKGGKLKLNYNGTYRLSMPDLSDYHLLDAAQKLEYERLAGMYTDHQSLDNQYKLDELYAQNLRQVHKGVNTDWLSKPLRNGFSQNHNLSLDGGDDFARYTVGLRYGKDNGVMKGSDRERVSSYFRLSYNKNGKIYIANSSTIYWVKSQDSPYGSFSQYAQLNPYDSPYDENGDLRPMLSYMMVNPLYEASLGSYSKGDQFNFMNNTEFRYWIRPEWRIDATFGFTKFKNDTRRFISPLSKDELLKDDPAQRGQLTESFIKSISYSGKLMMSYNRYFFRKMYLSLMGGANVDAVSSDMSKYSSIGYYSEKLSHPAFGMGYRVGDHPMGNDVIDRTVGFFVNANTIYDNKYFLDVIYRYEGASKFGKDKRFAPFWSVGAGWNLHNEKFMKKLKVQTMKLRGSVGYLGNVGFSPYQALTTYGYDARYNYFVGIGAVPLTIGNPDLKWERTLNTNIGLDLTMFNSRLDFVIDAYLKNTDNLLLDVTKAPSVGVPTARENIGAIENKGVEFQARVVPIMNKDWYWALSLNYSYNKNKIKSISDALKKQNEENIKINEGKGPLPVYEEGQSLTAMKVVPSAGIDPATGNEVYIKRDGSYTFQYDPHDKIVFGDTAPYAFGRLGSFLTYKQFSLNMQFGYSLGGAIYNQTLASRVEGSNPRFNADERVLQDRWKQPGDHVKYKNIADQQIPQQTSRFVQVENYLDFKSLSLAYDFTPQQLAKIGVKRLRLEMLMNDLFYISSVKRERGLAYPFARSVECSVRFTF